MELNASHIDLNTERSIRANCGNRLKMANKAKCIILHVTQLQCNTVHSETLQLINCNNWLPNRMTYLRGRMKTTCERKKLTAYSLTLQSQNGVLYRILQYHWNDIVQRNDHHFQHPESYRYFHITGIACPNINKLEHTKIQ